MKHNIFQIVEKTPGYLKNIFTVRANIDRLGPAERKAMLEYCDEPFGAPFGGTINQNVDGTYEVVVYTD